MAQNQSLLTRHAVLITLASVVTFGCGHLRRPVPVPLAGSLVLEFNLESPNLHRGANVRAQFLLRNASARPVEFCQEDGGVEIIATVTGGGIFPLRGYGAVLDAPCYNRGKLAPGEAREYIEEFAVVPTLSSGQLRGMIRLHSRDWKDNVTISSASVPITIK